MQWLKYLSLLLPVAVANPLSIRSTACNNSPDLCDKSYGAITHLGAHNSPFVRTSDGVLAGNQYVMSSLRIAVEVQRPQWVKRSSGIQGLTFSLFVAHQQILRYSDSTQRGCPTSNGTGSQRQQSVAIMSFLLYTVGRRSAQRLASFDQVLAG